MDKLPVRHGAGPARGARDVISGGDTVRRLQEYLHPCSKHLNRRKMPTVGVNIRKLKIATMFVNRKKQDAQSL
jgi:hypothetical protein